MPVKYKVTKKMAAKLYRTGVIEGYMAAYYNLKTEPYRRQI